MSDRWLRLTLTLTLVVLAGLALFSLFVLLRQPSAADARPLALAPLPAPDAGEREVEFNVFHAARARDPADEAAGPEAAVSADTTGGGPASEAVPTPEEARDLLVTAGRRYISRDHRWLAPIRALVPDHAGLALAVSRELLTDPRPLVAGKVGAIKALGRLGGPEALTLLLLAAESDPNTFVRRTAIEELEALGENPGVSARLIAAAERERDESLRARLLAAAGQVGVAADLSGLYAIAARERDVPTRGEALVAVLRIGDAEQERRVRDIVSADAGLRDYVRGVVATERVTVGGAAAGPADETVRYLTRYDDKFFLDGAPPLDLSAEMVRPIGVHVDLGGADLSLQNVANEVFRHSPLDRYRGAFYFRLVNELEVELERDLPSPTAYDSYGLRIPGGKPIVSGQVGFYLYFNRVDRAACGCAGFSAGNEANVTKDSLMHEIGHAFAGLGDEYDSTAASKAPAPNLELRAAPRLKWQGLIDQGHVPADRVPRVEMIGERDDGQYLVPSRRCFMNNHLNPPDERYCPVCQLAIIDAICRITGVAPPWALSTKR